MTIVTDIMCHNMLCGVRTDYHVYHAAAHMVKGRLRRTDRRPTVSRLTSLVRQNSRGVKNLTRAPENELQNFFPAAPVVS